MNLVKKKKVKENLLKLRFFFFYLFPSELIVGFKNELSVAC